MRNGEWQAIASYGGEGKFKFSGCGELSKFQDSFVALGDRISRRATERGVARRVTVCAMNATVNRRSYFTPSQRHTARCVVAPTYGRKAWGTYHEGRGEICHTCAGTSANRKQPYNISSELKRASCSLFFSLYLYLMKGPLLCSRKGDNFLWDLLIIKWLRSSSKRTKSDLWKIWHRIGSVFFFCNSMKWIALEPIVSCEQDIGWQWGHFLSSTREIFWFYADNTWKIFCRTLYFKYLFIELHLN